MISSSYSLLALATEFNENHYSQSSNFIELEGTDYKYGGPILANCLSLTISDYKPDYSLNNKGLQNSEKTGKLTITDYHCLYYSQLALTINKLWSVQTDYNSALQSVRLYLVNSSFSGDAILFAHTHTNIGQSLVTERTPTFASLGNKDTRTTNSTYTQSIPRQLEVLSQLLSKLPRLLNYYSLLSLGLHEYVNDLHRSFTNKFRLAFVNFPCSQQKVFSQPGNKLQRGGARGTGNPQIFPTEGRLLYSESESLARTKPKNFKNFIYEAIASINPTNFKGVNQCHY